MLMQTDITFAGCRIWLDGETKRELTSVTGQLERWVFDHVGDPPKFSAVKKRVTKIPKQSTITERMQSIRRKPVHEIQT